MEMQRRSVEGSLGLCKVLGDFVPMGFRASVCIYLLNTNCLQDGKRIGVPSVVVLRILGGVLDVQANGAGVGLEARRAEPPPCFKPDACTVRFVMQPPEPVGRPQKGPQSFYRLVSSLYSINRCILMP